MEMVWSCGTQIVGTAFSTVPSDISALAFLRRNFGIGSQGFRPRRAARRHIRDGRHPLGGICGVIRDPLLVPLHFIQVTNRMLKVVQQLLRLLWRHGALLTVVFDHLGDTSFQAFAWEDAPDRNQDRGVRPKVMKSNAPQTSHVVVVVHVRASKQGTILSTAKTSQIHNLNLVK